ncbi:MAG TPA: DUF732 domain-containing protein [Acidimicrobiales bacterium]|nr:DUF732 domain-containing protein [Acidimicrobiales bacterium]
MPRRLPTRVVVAAAMLAAVATGCRSGAKPASSADTTTTESVATARFLAKAKQLGAIGPDDEILLLGLDYCGLARRGPIGDAVSANFHGFSQNDRMQASFILTAAGTDLCPDQAQALSQAAAQVLTLS